MTELEKLSLSQPLTDVYNAMEQDLMIAIAKQIAKDGEISATSQWRLQRLAEAGDLDQTAIAIIVSYTGIQSDLLTEALSGAANSVIDKLEPGFRELAKQGLISDTPVPASKSVNRAIQTFRKQAASDLNLVNTVMRYKAKQAYVDLVNKTYDAVNAVADVPNRQELLNTLGKHTMSTVMGIESRQEAVRKCIKEFSDKGIPAFVDAAGREWSPEAYINMDIRTTVSNTANAAQDARCDDYGIDLIEVSSHPGARPKCAPYQGRIFSRSNQSGITHDGNGNEIRYEPLSSTSYGEPDGLFGINCKHKKYPFIDGVNFQRYFPYDKEENDKRYKEIQEQRRLERQVRKTKTEADMLKEVGDTEGAKAARAKLKTQRQAYKQYCDEHELTQRNDRLTVSKTSASVDKKALKPLDNGGGSGIIKMGKVKGAYKQTV
ncbi:MAG: phage minor capsid protein, partial [Oscillospiraceae bacterium]